MVKGLYTAYTGMLNQQNRMDVLTNNLANSATVGFKKKVPPHRRLMTSLLITSRISRIRPMLDISAV